jgi:3-oxoacyl-[acyl-carrier protein] reductase
VSGKIDLGGRAAIVTGGARGIGRACALALAREGADVAVADLLPADETVAAVERLGRRAWFRRTDVSRREEVEAFVREVLDRFGRIDILVNNAGIGTRNTLEETTDASWARDLGVILGGAFLFTQAVYPHMQARAYGKIVNVSSISGKIGGAVSRREDSPEAMRGRSGPGYAAAKGGVIAFTKWVAKDGGRYGIYCNTVAPGPVRTEMTKGYDYNVAAQPIPRMAEPEDIAEAVLFLASNASNYITGTVLDVDGGLLMD